MEDLFSQLEDRWPLIVERLIRRDDVNGHLEDIFNFIALQRARVPASRDACEAMLAESVKATARLLDAMGEFEPKPKGLENILDHVVVSIDPHQSIHAMVDVIRGTGRVFDQIGIGSLQNNTDTPFLTSDNPVIWFDPSIPDEDLRPYTWHIGGPVVLLFPVTPNILIYGHSSMREEFSRRGFSYSTLTAPGFVETINRQICRFAYRSVFAQSGGQENLIIEHSGESPIVQSQTIATAAGLSTFHQSVFGKRRIKPKWNSN